MPARYKPAQRTEGATDDRTAQGRSLGARPDGVPARRGVPRDRFEQIRLLDSAARELKAEDEGKGLIDSPQLVQSAQLNC